MSSSPYLSLLEAVPRQKCRTASSVASEGHEAAQAKAAFGRKAQALSAEANIYAPVLAATVCREAPCQRAALLKQRSSKAPSQGQKAVRR
jgi:hypothetical protein